ncbi:hypothetical protein N9V98_00945 [Luminiphilus sp.]|nr:hypothetical protein [Luminiphilus sp.]
MPAKRGNVSGVARHGGVNSGREGGVLLPLAKVSQDPVDDVLFLNASDDFDGPATATTNFHIDIEYALESLGPGHRGMPFNG